jgi:hypothetical protein
MLLYPTRFRAAVSSPGLASQWTTWVLLSDVMRSEREADHLSPRSAQVKIHCLRSVYMLI